VGRLHQVCLVLAAALGLAGCLLFSDPINKAPTVTVSTSDSPIYRNQPATFVATVADDKDPSSVLRLRWDRFDAQGESCQWITHASWRSAAALPYGMSDVRYTFTPSTLKAACVCAEVIDSNGATGQGCSPPITPISLPPTAIIIDESGALSNQPRALCSPIRLSAEKSLSPSGDPLQFEWAIEYSGTDPGTDPAGKSIKLAPCDGATPNDGTHRCFVAGVPGTYTVRLTVTDTPDPTSISTKRTSDPFVIPVKEDAPPCIRRSDPDAYAQLTLLSRGSDQSRTFKALSVDDDCEPYPALASSKAATQFAWSVLDLTQPASSGEEAWVPQADTGDSFTVSQSQFPNARPGDSIKIRLEVRDSMVQEFYRKKGVVCPDTTDICCGPGGCTGANDCVRWTTWTVQFLP
jgi:hypothetical protein